MGESSSKVPRVHCHEFDANTLECCWCSFPHPRDATDPTTFPLCTEEHIRDVEKQIKKRMKKDKARRAALKEAKAQTEGVGDPQGI